MKSDLQKIYILFSTFKNWFVYTPEKRISLKIPTMYGCCLYSIFNNCGNSSEFAHTTFQRPMCVQQTIVYSICQKCKCVSLNTRCGKTCINHAIIVRLKRTKPKTRHHFQLIRNARALWVKEHLHEIYKNKMLSIIVFYQFCILHDPISIFNRSITTNFIVITFFVYSFEWY